MWEEKSRVERKNTGTESGTIDTTVLKRVSPGPFSFPRDCSRRNIDVANDRPRIRANRARIASRQPAVPTDECLQDEAVETTATDTGHGEITGEQQGTAGYDAQRAAAT